MFLRLRTINFLMKSIGITINNIIIFFLNLMKIKFILKMKGKSRTKIIQKLLGFDKSA
jgi:hypothetical protein